MKARSNFSKKISQTSRSLGASIKGSASRSLKHLKQAGNSVSKKLIKNVGGDRSGKKRKSFAEHISSEKKVETSDSLIATPIIEVTEITEQITITEAESPKKDLLNSSASNILQKAFNMFRRNHIQEERRKEQIEEEFDIDVPPATTIIQKNPEVENKSAWSVVATSSDIPLPKPKLPSAPVYADYASLTPVDPRVKKVMFEAIDQYAANPSSLYKRGVQAKKALEDARMSVAAFFSSNKNEIIFTSGGTESNNMVFRGVLKGFYEYESSLDEEKIKNKSNGSNSNGNSFTSNSSERPRPHFIISTIEHPSIIEIALDLINEGIDVSFIPVNSEGLIDPKDIRKALKPETVLISVIYANNEIGTVQPLKEIAREVRHFKKSLGRDNSDYPYIHSDACQAALYEDMRILSLNIDLMTIDGGKVYGPRGTGVLVKRRHVRLSPLFLGGNQENGLRAGTENLPAIIGLKHALDIVHSERDIEAARLLEFRETLLEIIMTKLQDKIPGIAINGSLSARLPNNLNICFPNIDAEFLVLRLDVLGVELSSVTSCRATNDDSSSYVIEALGRHDCALSSLRISLGRFTTAEDVGIIAEKVCEAVLEQYEEGKG